MSTSDAERSGHPVEVTIPEIIEEIDDMMLDDRKMKVIANAVDISIERIYNILSIFGHEKIIHKMDAVIAHS